MSQTLKHLKALNDPTRLRLLALLQNEELSVNELQNITELGQSRISTHLSLLQEAGLLISRREGKRSLYKINNDSTIKTLSWIVPVIESTKGQAEHKEDAKNLKRVINQRNKQHQLYFNQVAGRFDQKYGPGRSWQAFGKLLIELVPPLDIADLGSGEGLVGELLAQKARNVFCVDISKKIVRFGQTNAIKNGIKNIEFLHGDIEKIPLKTKSVDVALFSQSLHHAKKPQTAINEAHRILRASGQLIILDLLEHQFTQAKEVYGDHWLGFSKNTLHNWIEESGFSKINLSEADREEDPPHFTTLLATAQKHG
tara:strand:- start:671 stop:1606 length:936 start_codon:yes stop_codon:yes gene_type:complete